MKLWVTVLVGFGLVVGAGKAQDSQEDRVRSPRGDFTIAVPSGWQDAEPETGDLELTNDPGVNITFDHGASLANPGDRATALLAELKKRGQALDEKSRTDVTMDFMPGVLVHATTQVDGATFDYLITVVSGEDRHYEIVSIGAHNDFVGMKAANDAVRTSFQRGE